ncbi:PREDICTED: peptidyl-prolyl cis-trans isomerase FKBP43-like [Camelina sativa]|uniref:peptidylprolyl isomerase n=1 Tax=Camelina sativa TaxID=90675 RepID=A0ABM1RE54_CAMSA|nr:PREDICTED: peptidyl-prolyl cis-trans isomerase FKBP43-like [Camelina sativa]
MNYFTKILGSFAYIYLVGEGAVDKALQLDGSDVGGWNVSVKPFPFPETAKDKVLVRVEGLDTSLSKIDIQNALNNLWSSYGEVLILNIFNVEGYAVALIDGKNIADKAHELNGIDMGGRKLAVCVLSVPRIHTIHARRRYLPPRALPDSDSSTFDEEDFPSQCRSESSKTPDQPPEKKRRSKEEQQTADRDGVIVEQIVCGDPFGKEASVGKWVFVYITARLKESGEVFCSNDGRKPSKIRLGHRHVIEAVDIGIIGMRVGEQRRLTIPPALG